MLLFGIDSALGQWASERLDGRQFSPPFVAIGVAHRGRIVAAAVYNNFCHPDIHVTFVTSSPRWASPGAVAAIFRYPFRQLGCRRITAVTAESNDRARLFLERLGFRREGYHPDARIDGASISYGLLLRDAERWMRHHEQASDSASPS
jgi:RimJ/RimL family protein N-acetyltransferase